MDCASFACESRSSFATFHWHPTNQHWLSQPSFWWIPQTAGICDWINTALRELSASIINGLCVETGVNPNVHIMHVVLKLDPSKCCEIVCVTGGNKTRIPFAPLAANPPDKRSGGLNVCGEVTSGFGESSICLLYTSPSPRDRQKSRMPSSA